MPQHMVEAVEKVNRYTASPLVEAFQNLRYPQVGQMILKHPRFHTLRHPMAAAHLANLCFDGLGPNSHTQLSFVVDELEGQL